MRFREFRIGNRLLIDPKEINDALIKNDMSWLIDSEIEDASVEIRNNTLIWNNGVYRTGDWYYGLWRDGYFYGTWENGIWEKGIFKGKWISGVK
jgi:hypothetical protein